MYFKKYLKYKDKYLNLKKQHGGNWICDPSKEIKDMCKEISLKIETEVPEDTIIYNTKNECDRACFRLKDRDKITYIPNIYKIIQYADKRQLTLIHNDEKIIDRRRNPQKYNFIQIIVIYF